MPVAFHTQLLPGQEYFWPGLRLHHSLAQLSFSNLRFPLALSNFAYAYKCQPGRGTEPETGAGTGRRVQTPRQTFQMDAAKVSHSLHDTHTDTNTHSHTTNEF